MENLKKGKLLYEGKAKKLYEIQGRPDHVILFFKDHLSAAQGRKKGSFEGKGALCCRISSLIFQYLKTQGLAVHWLKDISPVESLCLKSSILPLEVVVRNRLAGSTAKRLGFKNGARIKGPLLEFYLKNDDLDDPFVSEEQIRVLRLIEDSSLLPPLKQQALDINSRLIPFFGAAGLELVDFKMEFGLWQNKLFLADEISPDTCRLWDKETGDSLDKDRFRLSMGDVKQGYQQILERLKRA